MSGSVDDAIANGEIQLVEFPQSYDLTAIGSGRASPFSGIEAEHQFRSKVRVHCLAIADRVAATAILPNPEAYLAVHWLDPTRRKLQSGQNLGRRPRSQICLAGIKHFRPPVTGADQVYARDSWREMGTH
jgi:hypothetical protein